MNKQGGNRHIDEPLLNSWWSCGGGSIPIAIVQLHAVVHTCIHTHRRRSTQIERKLHVPDSECCADVAAFALSSELRVRRHKASIKYLSAMVTSVESLRPVTFYLVQYIYSTLTLSHRSHHPYTGQTPGHMSPPLRFGTELSADISFGRCHVVYTLYGILWPTCIVHVMTWNLQR